ncbi:YeeE/YedE family protein [Catenovulum sp. 2E275]|uniref:YeeE/YedE family protein n=1 Tax=Catenovulum sp. 2E275 TaxID=2980497 RepID=UPI0021CF4ADC|nr:YeeE/YedE family protein [Catenovulum sp. 2E275]MCU4674579.1 YeeE/YedE family protein [Catenovulum sp. 2E275]
MRLWLQIIIAFSSGLIFGLGLIVSQMANPEKVIHFLDISGNWDPSLAFVMAGALCVFIPVWFLYIKKLNKPLLGETFSLPSNTLVDKNLILGAIFFGIGWGLAGICPGPALVNLTGDTAKILVFILAMIVGMFTAKYVNITNLDRKK